MKPQTVKIIECRLDFTSRRLCFFLPGRPSHPSQKFPKDSIVPVLEESIGLLLSCALHISLQFLQHSPLQKIHFAHGADGAQSYRASGSSPLDNSRWFTQMEYPLNWKLGPQDIAGSQKFSRWRPLRKQRNLIRDFTKSEGRYEYML